MKILITTGIFLPELGGPATYAPKIAKEWLEQGHQVAVLTYSDSGQDTSDRDLAYPVYRIKRSNKIANYWRYYQTLKKVIQGYDVVYAFDHFSAGLPTALACRRYAKPFFIRVGGDFIWEQYLDRSSQMVTMRQFYYQGLHLQHKLQRFRLIKWIFRQAQGIIFTTSFQRDVFTKYYQLDENKLEIIANPVDDSHAGKIQNNSSREILFAGRFINKNNIINLIKAFSAVKDKSLSLVLIGEGPLQPELEKMIQSYPQKQIRIEAKLTREKLRERMADAYLMIFPSLTDISPNSMLECLSLNVPFISSVEIGFNWIKDKIRVFDPLSTKEISETIDDLSNQAAYQDYKQEISAIEYNYVYSQAAKDTIDIFQKNHA